MRVNFSSVAFTLSSPVIHWYGLPCFNKWGSGFSTVSSFYTFATEVFHPAFVCLPVSQTVSLSVCLSVYLSVSMVTQAVCCWGILTRVSGRDAVCDWQELIRFWWRSGSRCVGSGLELLWRRVALSECFLFSKSQFSGVAQRTFSKFCHKTWYHHNRLSWGNLLIYALFN